MPKEQTVVSLGKEAKAAVEAAMKRRGETYDTYFSGAPVRMVAPVERPLPNPDKSEVFEDTRTAVFSAYGKQASELGLRAGREQVGVTMSLFKSPEQARAKARPVAAAVSDMPEPSGQDEAIAMYRSDQAQVNRYVQPFTSDETVKVMRKQGAQRIYENWMESRPSERYPPKLAGDYYVHPLAESEQQLAKQATALRSTLLPGELLFRSTPDGVTFRQSRIFLSQRPSLKKGSKTFSTSPLPGGILER